MENNWVSYKNGNYIVALDTAHGTKIRYNDLDFQGRPSRKYGH